MIVNLLPGLRELRAPLASGYLWLLTGWLIFAPLVPPISGSTGIWADTYRLGEAVGRSGVLAAVTFAAYIVGIFNERIAYLVARFLQSMRIRKPRELAKIWPYDILRDIVTNALIDRYRTSEAFRDEIRARMTPATLMTLSPDYVSTFLPNTKFGEFPHLQAPERDPELQRKFADATQRVIDEAEQSRDQLGLLLREQILVEGTIEELRQDLLLLPARLVGKEPEIYERWDRLRAESEFRISVALPLFVLALVLAIRLHPIFALLVLPSGYLVQEGLAKSRAATSQLAESLRAGRVSSPVLDRVRSGEPQWRYQPRSAIIAPPTGNRD